MVVEKEKRNKEFVKAWKNLGLGNKELGTKFDMTLGGVKSLKARLRKKMPELYSRMVDRKSERMEMPVTFKRKVSFYLDPDLVKELKIAAVDREVTASDLAEKFLRRAMIDAGIL